MNSISRDIDITVVCPQAGMLNVLNRIRKWHVDDPHGKRSVRYVARARELAEGLLAAQKSPERSILIPIGYREADVFELLTERLLQQLEIIIRPPRPSNGPEIDELPSASLLADRHVVVVQDTLPALHKVLLKLDVKHRVRIRELGSEDDFRQFFALRYRVWKHMVYLPPEQDCPATQWELNFTDRTAYPIGAFTPEGVLIGCARLVFPLGQDSHHLHRIEALIAATNDPALARNLAYPLRLQHPFDLLESFDGFRQYFMRLIRRRIRCAEVSRVIVAPEYRAEGVGEVIVDSLVTLARLRQLQVLFLACNTRLKSFYERCGFYALPGLTCERFAGVNAPAIGMAVKLTRPGEITLH